MTIPDAFQLALQHHRAGRLGDAEGIYRQILAVEPRHADALHHLGVIAHQAGRNDLAVAMIRQAIALLPHRPDCHSNLGVALREQGQLDQAIAAFQRAIALQPDYAEAHNNLGSALRERGCLAEAIAAHRRALQLQPDLVEAHNNLGVALTEQRQFDEALAACRQAIQLAPDYADAHYNLGNALKEQGRLDEALAAYRRALDLKPDDAMACNNLGNVLKDQAQLDEAMACYRRAVAWKPGDAGLHSNLVYTAHFHPDYDWEALRVENALWEERHARPLDREIQPHSNTPEPARRLRIGYVSPNFSRHVIAHFLTPLLEAHDHAEFEVFCYASVKRPDRITERLMQCADGWRDVRGVRDEDLAGRIRADGIDILVDLTQHMEDNRLLVFARKPAPVQVAWVGYPGSTGLRAIDYRFTDSRLEPVGAAWSESVEMPVRLPDSWFCFDPLGEFPAPGPLPALREGGLTFGSLNNFCKANDRVLRLWSSVLLAVPGSRLVLQCPEGGHRERVRRLFESHGIDPQRVQLVARTSTRDEFLDLLQRIDIALDPLPYNGGTTTCEALWMGLPVLTLPESRIVSRIGLSILSTIGFPEWAADSEAGFVNLASSLAGDLPRLAHLRATLRDRMQASPFMDGPRFARNVEHAYREMWRAWCATRSAMRLAP